MKSNVILRPVVRPLSLQIDFNEDLTHVQHKNILKGSSSNPDNSNVRHIMSKHTNIFSLSDIPDSKNNFEDSHIPGPPPHHWSCLSYL
ncbi:hypothetical protein NPIL_194931 [Nephila pilipes]|uniref:Uncharacterized protein n=1 Tax=Nephila pilipes TaxID=299642 RepID=A0A8X6TUK3_NEPPI|nr:hypothetical protein NPIL_194931 [Nephila pilipes]